MSRFTAVGETSPRAAARWASYALCLLLPLSVFHPLGPSPVPQALDRYVRPGLYLSDLPLVALLLTGLAGWRARAREWGTPRLTLPLLVLAGLAMLTVPAALSPGLAAYMALRWLAAVGVYLGLACGDVPLERLVVVFMVGLGFHVLIGVGQVWLQRPLGLPGELALEPSRPGAAIIDVGGTRWLRAHGLTFHPNVLGGCLAVGLLLGLPLLDRRWVRVLWWLLCLGLLITFSRSAWLAVAVAMPPAVGWLLHRRPPLRRSLVVALLGGALIAALAVAPVTGQLLTRLRPLATPVEHRSVSERGVLQAVAVDIIAMHPLTGVGAGNFSPAMLAAGAPFPPQPVHSVPLLVAAEVGVLGGGLWLWLWLVPGMALTRHFRRAGSWAVALVSAWFALGVIGLWDAYPWALNAGRLLSATLLGLVSRALGHGEGGRSDVETSAQSHRLADHPQRDDALRRALCPLQERRSTVGGDEGCLRAHLWPVQPGCLPLADHHRAPERDSDARGLSLSA